MNELVLTAKNVPAEIEAMSSQEIRAVLAKGLTVIAKELVRLAACWAVLESRGEDLSDLKKGINQYLPLIASGRLAAEAVVAFAGKAMHLRCLDGVPLDMQRRLADGELIAVYMPGEKDPQAMPLARIPAAAVGIAIADGEVRTPSEQRLAMKTGRKKKAPDDSRKYSVSVDRKEHTIKIGKMTIPIATIIAAMAEAAGAKGEIIDTPANPARAIGGKFTDEERDRLRAACKAHGLDEWVAVRQAVVAMWML